MVHSHLDWRPLAEEFHGKRKRVEWEERRRRLTEDHDAVFVHEAREIPGITDNKFLRAVASGALSTFRPKPNYLTVRQSAPEAYRQVLAEKQAKKRNRSTT